jgi:hypothetical protein
MLIDSSAPKQPNQKGRIISPILAKSVDSTHCLTFSLYMYGSDVGTYNIYFNSPGDLTFTSPILSYPGSQGDYWVVHIIEIGFTFNYEFQVIFHFLLLLYHSFGRLVLY